LDLFLYRSITWWSKLKPNLANQIARLSGSVKSAIKRRGYTNVDVEAVLQIVELAIIQIEAGDIIRSTIVELGVTDEMTRDAESGR